MIRSSSSVLAIAVTLGLGMYSSIALAEWEGKGELGLALARGNTTSDSLNAKADVTRTVDPWKNTAGFSVLQSSARDPVTGVEETTGRRYELHGQSDYKINENSYVFGNARYENDDFAAYEYQAILAAGYGYKLIDSETTKLNAELGGGYRRQKERATGDQIDDGVVRGGVNYEQQLTANTKIYDKFLSESGSNNTFLQNEAGVQVSMTEKLALSVAHTVRHNTDVPPSTPPAREIKKTDQLLTANLVFAF